MEGPKELKEMTEFEGIQITKKVKYLGCNLTATRQAIYHETRKQINKHANLIQKKMRVKDDQTAKILSAAFGRSLLLYFATPLVVNGLWGLEEVSKFEHQ